MTELLLITRAARAGEIGMFCDAEPFREEWDSLPRDKEIKADCTIPANLKYLKFFWALATKVADNSPSQFLDKNDAAENILLASKHFKMVYDHLRNKSEMKVKSIAGLSGEVWLRLLKRVTYVVLTQYLPGAEEGALLDEIKQMIGIDVFAPDPEPEKPKRAPRKPKEPQAEERADAKPDGVGPSPEPSGHRAPPQNEAEYLTACRKWISKQTDRNAAFDYMDSTAQIELRAACKLSVGAGKMLRRELSEHFDKQKAGQNGKNGPSANSETRAVQGDDSQSKASNREPDAAH